MLPGCKATMLVLTAIIVAFSSVSARDCVLGTEPDQDDAGRVKLVLPSADPCTEVQLSGHNAFAPSRLDKPRYVDIRHLQDILSNGLGPSFESTGKKRISTYSHGVTTPSTPPADCQEILDAGQTTSGVYTIQHEGQNMQVYCRMESGNGYIVFQRRQDGSVNFDRTWQEYAEGFGDLTGEFWLGNQKLRSLTGNGGWELVVTLRAFDGDQTHAHYGRFKIYGNNYVVAVLDFIFESGEAGKSLRSARFSTRDNDNDFDDDGNCAEKFPGGWWYFKCGNGDNFWFDSNLNGVYNHNATVDEEMQGVMWASWKGRRESLKGCEMMTRRKP